jgi:hypothetical protein
MRIVVGEMSRFKDILRSGEARRDSVESRMMVRFLSWICRLIVKH